MLGNVDNPIYECDNWLINRSNTNSPKLNNNSVNSSKPPKLRSDVAVKQFELEFDFKVGLQQLNLEHVYNAEQWEQDKILASSLLSLKWFLFFRWIFLKNINVLKNNIIKQIKLFTLVLDRMLKANN